MVSNRHNDLQTPGSMMWRRLRHNRFALIGGIVLAVLYSFAIFAGFLSPYSPTEDEFRNHFFHPPVRLRFRDSGGRFSFAPHVARSYLVNGSRIHYSKTPPLRIRFRYPAENTKRFIPEMLEHRDGVMKVLSGSGTTMTIIHSMQETKSDSGIFAASVELKDITTEQWIQIVSLISNDSLRIPITAVQPSEIQTDSAIFVLNEKGKTVDSYGPAIEYYPVRFFVRGWNYRILGIFQSNLHLFGVEQPAHLFLFGTDQSGRDIFSRILFGAQISLTVGLVGMLITTCLGLLYGGVAGYYGGKLDDVMMRFVEILLSIPALYLILSVRNVIPEHLAAQWTYLLIIVILSFVGWAAMSRVVRGMVLSLRKQEYVMAARCAGASDFRILLRHILPNLAGFVIVRSTLLIPAYILGEVYLSFLSLGVREPIPSWGNMLSTAQNIRVLQQFTWTLIPGAFIFITVLAFNFLGDGLRDALDPKTT